MPKLHISDFKKMAKLVKNFSNSGYQGVAEAEKK